MNDPLLAAINTVREGKGEAPLSDIRDDMHLRNDLGFDSFDLAELTVRIEEACEVDVFSQGLVNTVGEIRRLINP
jgi:acyl carrier protein